MVREGELDDTEYDAEEKMNVRIEKKVNAKEGRRYNLI